LKKPTENSLIVQYGTVTRPSETAGNQTITPNTEDTALSFTLHFTQSSVSYQESQVQKSSELNFVGQLVALIGGSLSFWRLVLQIVEGLLLRKADNRKATDIELN
jgi:hypothetical protein